MVTMADAIRLARFVAKHGDDRMPVEGNRTLAGLARKFLEDAGHVAPRRASRRKKKNVNDSIRDLADSFAKMKDRLGPPQKTGNRYRSEGEDGPILHCPSCNGSLTVFECDPEFPRMIASNGVNLFCSLGTESSVTEFKTYLDEDGYLVDVEFNAFNGNESSIQCGHCGEDIGEIFSIQDDATQTQIKSIWT
jgi:hypothetical protein